MTDMVRVAVKNRVPVCSMHNRKTVDYKDFYKDFINDMKECIRLLWMPVYLDDIILDPGIGLKDIRDESIPVESSEEAA